MAALSKQPEPPSDVVTGVAVLPDLEPAPGAARDLSPEPPLPHTLLWFLIYGGWLLGLALIARVAFQGLQAGNVWAAGPWLLALMCFYLSLCNALAPLPTGWIVMLAATSEPLGPGAPTWARMLLIGLSGGMSTGSFGPWAPAWARVLLIGLCGGVSTAMANLNEYHVLSLPLGAPLRRRARQTGVYQWAVHWLEKSPFQVLATIALLPIPIDAVRWLAILDRYPRLRFGAAYVLGRGVRYSLFAWLSCMLRLTFVQILLVQVGIIVTAVTLRLLIALIRRRGRAAVASGP